MIDIMVIGDCLTAVEARNKTMMTGPAVDILKQTLSKVGMPTSKEVVHYTVAIKQPITKKKGYKIPKEIMDVHRVTLLQEIKKIQPKIILTLGKTPLQVLTGDYNLKITSEYARPRYYSYCGGAQVIPVMHPALIMRAPGDYKPFLASLQLVSQLYDGGSEYDTGETKYIVLADDAQCEKAINYLQEYKYLRVAADIETTGLDYRIAEFCVMGICFEKNKVFVIPRAMRHWCADFFAIPNLKWTWHHGKYDRKVLWRRNLTQFDKLGFHIFPHDNDTIYMHYMLDETSAHDLGYLTKTFLQAKDYKYKMNQEFKAVELETYDKYFDALCERVAVDSDYTFQLEEVLQAELNKESNESIKQCYQELIMPAAGFLARVEQNGMLVDVPILDDMNVRYDKMLEKILAEVEEAASNYWDRSLYMEQTGAKSASVKFNPASPKQMAWMVFDRMKLKPRRRKARSTGAEILESIEQDIPLIKKVLEYRGVAKEQSTYVVGTLKRRDEDGRVRSNFNLHITATGRLSSKEPNIQNVPSAKGVGNVRKSYLPPKGKIFMEIDYSGAELRWMAFLSGCPVLKDVFMNGRNLHKETATALYGPNFTKQQKMRAKAVNFGIPYGREAKSFQDEFNISKEDAEFMVKGWLDNYHGCRDYLNWCAEQVSLGNYLQTPWGNRRRAGLVTPESLHGLQNEFKNFPIQCSSSHTLLYSSMKVEKRLREEFDTSIVNLIHDSMLLEVPKDPKIVQAVAQYVCVEMAKTPKDLFNCDIPFISDVDLGPDWGSLVAYNKETGEVELDEDDPSKNILFEDWVDTVYHFDKYEQDWYKTLKHL